MKKLFNLFALLFFLNTSLSLKAQNCLGDKCNSIVIDNYNRPNQSQHFVASPDGGIIYVYQLVKKKKDPFSFRVLKYSKELEVVIDTTISFPVDDIWSFEIYGVSDSNASYLVLNGITDLVKSKYYDYRYWVYKIDIENKVSVSSDKVDLNGYDKLSIFISNNDLYIYSGLKATNFSAKSEEFYSLKSGNKTEMKLIQFSGKDLKAQTITLNSPSSIDYGDKAHQYTFWEYAYSKDNTHYFLVRDVKDLSNVRNILIGFDNKGEVKDEITLDSKIPTLSFVLPTFIADECSSFRNTLDYSTKTSHVKQYADLVDKSFYVFGFYGPKESAKTYNEYDGFYVFKYDLDGKLIWKKTFDAVKEHADEKHFRKNMGESRIKLKRDLDGNLYVELKSWPINTNLAGGMEITASRYFINNENGSLITSEMFNGALAFDKYLHDSYSEYTSGKDSKSVNFVQGISPKNRIYWDLNFFEFKDYQILAYVDLESQEVPVKWSNKVELKLLRFNRE